ncbi:transposase [Alkalibacillus silvisoli]
MTANRLLRLFDKRKLETKKVLPRAIDEFKGDAGGEKFQTIIADVENKEVIDILSDRKVETINDYLNSCDTCKVEIVVMELSKSFKRAVWKALGGSVNYCRPFSFHATGILGVR